MSLFKKLSSEGLEEAQDRLGGFTPLKSNIYPGEIKMAYATTSDGGAQAVNLIIAMGGRDYRETIYVTNKQGENYFMSKNKEGKVDANSKKMPLPGFTMVDNICLIASGKPLAEQDVEDKAVNIYDSEAKREIPKSMPVLVDLIGGKVAFAVQEQLEDVKKKAEGSNAYVPTGETKVTNAINAVFDIDSQMTVNEARAEAEKAVFWDSWLEKNKDKQIDKTTKNPQGGAKATAGGPPKAGGSAPTPAGGERKSLFSKK